MVFEVMVNIARMEVTPTSGKGALDLGDSRKPRDPRTQYRDKVDVDGEWSLSINADDSSVCGPTLKFGSGDGRSAREARVSNRTREIRPSGIIGGPGETRPWWKCEPNSQPKG